MGIVSRDGEIRDKEVIIESLKKLFDNKTFSHKKVAVGISGNSIITKKISVPKMSREELKHQMYFEAEQYIPFDISEVNLDFAVINENRTDSMEVLLVAAKKDYIQNVTSVIESAGLKLEVVDCQAFALGNSFEFNYLTPQKKDRSNHVIVDFGASSTKLTIVEDDKTIFTRELRQCGINCTQLISERLSISTEQAEDLKVNQPNSPQLKTILSDYLQTLVDEISTSVDFAIAQGNEKVISGIYICGGGSRLEGLFRKLQEKFSYPIYPLNPIRKIAGSGQKMNSNALQELTYLGSVAVGLALRKPEDTL
jgi:type IV pilus assembly protein PilM